MSPSVKTTHHGTTLTVSDHDLITKAIPRRRLAVILSVNDADQATLTIVDIGVSARTVLVTDHSHPAPQIGVAREATMWGTLSDNTALPVIGVVHLDHTISINDTAHQALFVPLVPMRSGITSGLNQPFLLIVDIADPATITGQCLDNAATILAPHQFDCPTELMLQANEAILGISEGNTRARTPILEDRPTRLTERETPAIIVTDKESHATHASRLLKPQILTLGAPPALTHATKHDMTPVSLDPTRRLVRNHQARLSQARPARTKSPTHLRHRVIHTAPLKGRRPTSETQIHLRLNKIPRRRINRIISKPRRRLATHSGGRIDDDVVARRRDAASLQSRIQRTIGHRHARAASIHKKLAHPVGPRDLVKVRLVPRGKSGGDTRSIKSHPRAGSCKGGQRRIYLPRVGKHRVIQAGSLPAKGLQIVGVTRRCPICTTLTPKRLSRRRRRSRRPGRWTVQLLREVRLRHVVSVENISEELGKVASVLATLRPSGGVGTALVFVAGRLI